MNPSLSNRREFLRRTALSSAGVLLPSLYKRDVIRQTTTTPSYPFELGVASYSFRKFSRAEVIEMTKSLGVKYINLKSFHLPYEYTPNELAAGRREIESAGLSIVGGGTISIKKDSDDAIRPLFEYARHCGMPLMVIAPTPKVMPRVERLVQEFDIKVAIHNHGPEDKHFPAPADGLKIINHMDSRVGLCIDVGHTARTGIDVVQSIAEAGDRLLDIHMKDLKDLSKKRSQCAVGEGAMPVAAIFKQLDHMGYQGFVNLEYEIFPENPLEGMQRSFSYMRGVLDGLTL